MSVKIHKTVNLPVFVRGDVLGITIWPLSRDKLERLRDGYKDVPLPAEGVVGTCACCYGKVIRTKLEDGSTELKCEGCPRCGKTPAEVATFAELRDHNADINQPGRIPPDCPI